MNNLEIQESLDILGKLEDCFSAVSSFYYLPLTVRSFSCLFCEAISRNLLACSSRCHESIRRNINERWSTPRPAAFSAESPLQSAPELPAFYFHLQVKSDEERGGQGHWGRAEGGTEKDEEGKGLYSKANEKEREEQE